MLNTLYPMKAASFSGSVNDNAYNLKPYRNWTVDDVVNNPAVVMKKDVHSKKNVISFYESVLKSVQTDVSEKNKHVHQAIAKSKTCTSQEMIEKESEVALRPDDKFVPKNLNREIKEKFNDIKVIADSTGEKITKRFIVFLKSLHSGFDGIDKGVKKK